MDGKSPKFGIESRPNRVETKIEALNRRISDLTTLMKAVREMCSLLDPVQLYSDLAVTLRERLEVDALAVFLHQNETGIFELVFSHGLGDLECEFKMDKGPLTQKFNQNEPFNVIDGSDRPIFGQFFERHGLDRLRSKLWVGGSS